MLINTVILFLRDALPIFVLLSLLRVYVGTPWKQLSLGFATGILLAAVVVLNQHIISQWSFGAGYELLKSLTLICAYLMSAWLIINNRNSVFWLAGAVVAVFVVPRSAEFSIYVVGFWLQKDALVPIVLGTTLGLGICISVAILLDVILGSVKRRYLVQFTFSLFIAGQVANVVLLLQQIDWLTDPGPLWNMSAFISDESEYGHLLKVLIGYEAAPSSYYLSTLCFALLLPFAIRAIRLTFKRHKVSNLENHT
ncbi:hypothetical protein Patl_0641 [Paraglaciecola sp. T6c]|uniref:hypothetical protein n=1 Tax=Pseudoalteromonas atlantica (strain T6c / ATCC BAA-1087) TaxID=3042615 RepID=UPI00005C602A|nr:hypothetical protein [Paraglaciecola sp. T6c]ABG39170.1 hypothetical protein Patl_0641 [Paraglaciecola sp. T6c]